MVPLDENKTYLVLLGFASTKPVYVGYSLSDGEKEYASKLQLVDGFLTVMAPKPAGYKLDVAVEQVSDTLNVQPAVSLIPLEADASEVSGSFTVTTEGMLVLLGDGVDASIELSDGAVNVKGSGVVQVQVAPGMKVSINKAEKAYIIF